MENVALFVRFIGAIIFAIEIETVEKERKSRGIFFLRAPIGTSIEERSPPACFRVSAYRGFTDDDKNPDEYQVNILFVNLSLLPYVSAHAII